MGPLNGVLGVYGGIWELGFKGNVESYGRYNGNWGAYRVTSGSILLSPVLESDCLNRMPL